MEINNTLNQVKELKENEDNITFKLNDSIFLFVEVYAPVTDDEKFLAFELNNGYEDNDGYVLENVIDRLVLDYGDWEDAEEVIKRFLSAYSGLN